MSLPEQVQATSWSDWAALAPERPSTVGWMELSHPLTDKLPSPSYFPAPHFHRLMSLPDDLLNLTRLELMCHYGTHLDAPNHLIDGAPGIDEIPLSRLWGQAVVWQIHVEDDGLIEPEAFEAGRPVLNPGDMLVLHTGWAELIGSPRYLHHPALSVEAAQWLVDHGVNLVAFDFVTPDTPVDRRPPGFDFPVHRALLGAGVLIVENARTPESLIGRRVELLALPLPLVGADGSPIRLLARPVE